MTIDYTSYKTSDKGLTDAQKEDKDSLNPTNVGMEDAFLGTVSDALDIDVSKVSDSIDLSHSVYEQESADNAGLYNKASNDEELSKLGDTYDKMVGGLEGLAEEMMQGKIPDDVQQQVRQVASERAAAGGLGFGQGSRALTARDLGVTSLQIQAQGAQYAQTVAGLAEARREYVKNHELNTRSYLNEIRKTDLTEAELKESSRQYNITTQFSAAELLSKTMVSYHEIAATLATAEDDESGSITDLNTDFSALMASLKTMLGTTS